ncbi:Seryl-tRNA synthetase [hydrothermal vent metagenome]|uniref:Serine--tRNA ligase n=1 Tax=hydrothermal vent metagenome TaxID=652676 RepID=A0A3B0V7Y6_9ZZZZ
MLDPQILRNDIETTAKALAARGYQLDINKWNELEQNRKHYQVLQEQLQNQRTVKSKSIGLAKAKGEDIQPLLDEVKVIGEQLDETKKQFEKIQQDIVKIIMYTPNLAQTDVPLGKDETDNVELRTWGTPTEFDFKPKDHVDLGVKNNWLNAENAVKLSGSRFTVLSGSIAKLQRVLAQFMLNTHTTKNGYQEFYVPFLVNNNAMTGSGQLPKFADDAFVTTDEKYLIPTAEVPLTNIFADTIIKATDLPIKMTAHTPCFRKEAGSYGKDTRGMIRQHQFEKVEMVQLVHPHNSQQALEEMTADAEGILQALDIPYRTIILCTGDMGFGAAKTYDIEVWLPGENQYREISSCSNCTDFQARRMKTRYRDDNDQKPQLVHTLNGSGLAVGRCLIAVMENYQNADGSITIPTVLRPYFGDLTVLE